MAVLLDLIRLGHFRFICKRFTVDLYLVYGTPHAYCSLQLLIVTPWFRIGTRWHAYKTRRVAPALDIMLAHIGRNAEELLIDTFRSPIFSYQNSYLPSSANYKTVLFFRPDTLWHASAPGDTLRSHGHGRSTFSGCFCQQFRPTTFSGILTVLILLPKRF